MTHSLSHDKWRQPLKLAYILIICQKYIHIQKKTVRLAFGKFHEHTLYLKTTRIHKLIKSMTNISIWKIFVSIKYVFYRYERNEIEKSSPSPLRSQMLGN